MKKNERNISYSQEVTSYFFSLLQDVATGASGAIIYSLSDGVDDVS